MALQSEILAGNARLELAANGGPSVKPAPPADDVDAVKRIQRALQRLGQPLPKSFPNGPTGEPDGKYGQETFQAVIKFQQQVFPTQPGEWDGRVGKKTLEKMDALLPKKGGAPTPPPPPPAKDHPTMIKEGFDASRGAGTGTGPAAEFPSRTRPVRKYQWQ
jgi:peptidoglycan hydrolase-like protein with peptidoglycan-binding domain